MTSGLPAGESGASGMAALAAPTPAMEPASSTAANSLFMRFFLRSTARARRRTMTRRIRFGKDFVEFGKRIYLAIAAQRRIARHAACSLRLRRRLEIARGIEAAQVLKPRVLK